MLPCASFRLLGSFESERSRKVGGSVMAPVPASVARQAEILKQDGNSYFSKNRLGAAIDAYTEAITLCPDVAVYWTNRALCYMKRKFAVLLFEFCREWDRVEEDCTSALHLDSHSVKAHYMMGHAMLERHDYSGGIKQLQKALELGRGAKPSSYIVEEIWQVLSKAKYLEWEDMSSKRASELQKLKETCEKALLNFYAIEDSQDGTEEIADERLQQLQYLEEVFTKAGEDDRPKDVPDYLCCQISLDIFRDPVITPSGITYERAVLLDHLQKVGKFDPVTRVPLEQHQLVPNLAVKEAVQSFLNRHGWAYKMS
ncbi:E3 ubiquitin-protein ligase CHIP-like isoform X1 [Zingiber officinale]|uniref:E3 ubiquitin-protein ligase CHIP-like isoform X1 n=1 Tax=Zingiber officinale TaxID=94328 RepID=UPI001C4D2BCB|nr:E3 ubiquitin-protein ligase CHIP-like isoform X1 [Zingiber officinale]